MGNRFELWDKKKWAEETNKALQLSHDNLAQLLTDFSL